MTGCVCSSPIPLRLSRRRFSGFPRAVKYRRKLIAGRLVGIVEAERGHRDEVRADGPKIGALARLGATPLDAHPIIGPPPRIEPIVDAQEPRIAQALRRCCDAFDRPWRTIRKVDIYDHAFGPTHIEESLYQVTAMLHRRLPRRGLAPVLGGVDRSADHAHGDGRNAEQTPLDGTSNSTGIGYVVGEILAAVDT